MSSIKRVNQLLANMQFVAAERQATILLVEDDENNRNMLVRKLNAGDYSIIEAVNGVEALKMLAHNRIDLVLLDIMMPEMNGYQVLRVMKATPAFREIPVVVITAINDTETAVKCIELGADDYLNKPYNTTLLKARINALLDKKRLEEYKDKYKQHIEFYNRRLEEQVNLHISEISSAQTAAIFAMSKLAESRDPDTGSHLDRMREYCRVLAVSMAKRNNYAYIIDDNFIANIYAASSLHDIGKVGVPDNVLLKPASLDHAEWNTMKLHPLIGAETLKAVDREHPGNEFIKTGIAIAEYHHERWDGTGYPYGLKEKDIPLEARILALGDVYDALTSKRCYKDAFDQSKAKHIILAGKGTHFDPDVVDAFLDMEEEFIRIRNEYNDDSE